MGDFRKLLAYQKGFQNAMEIYEMTKTFPIEERYSLTDQIRRSSRSVCINLCEGYRKRRYPKHWVSKLTDSDMENTESMGWLEFALACKYIDQEKYESLWSKFEEVGRLLNYMIENPDKFR